MRISLITIVSALLLSSAAAAGVCGPRGNIAAGEQRFNATPEGGQSCASCHLEGGTKSIDGNTPLLAGQYADYLEKSLKDYRDGRRKNVIMAAQAAQLTDAEISDMAAFLASKPGEIHVYGRSDE